MWGQVRAADNIPPGAWDLSYPVPVPVPSASPTRPRSGLAGAYAAFGASPAGRWFAKHVSCRVDPFLLRISRGRFSTVSVYPVVLLTARGARSGEPRTTPLLYFTDGDRVVLIASNYGGTKHPAWCHNVRANPEVTLSAGGHTGRYRGTEVTGAERDRLWGLAKQMAENYGQYEQMTAGRQIPLFVFVPA
jgi:deazaflavin-dependent oxidoreductase (nitroreductase family)